MKLWITRCYKIRLQSGNLFVYILIYISGSCVRNGFVYIIEIPQREGNVGGCGEISIMIVSLYTLHIALDISTCRWQQFVFCSMKIHSTSSAIWFVLFHMPPQSQFSVHMHWSRELFLWWSKHIIWIMRNIHIFSFSFYMIYQALEFVCTAYLNPKKTKLRAELSSTHTTMNETYHEKETTSTMLTLCRGE